MTGYAPHAELTDEVREELALYVFGLLEGEDALRVSRHLKAGCEVCREEFQTLERTAQELPKALDRVTPAAHVRERVLERVRTTKRSAAEEPEPGIFVVRGAAREWKRTPFAGVTYRLLYVDRATGYATTLLKLDAGARYPAHHHAGIEQSWVVEGSCRIGAVAIERGDFAWALAETDHGVVESDNGCVLLIVASQRDEVFV